MILIVVTNRVRRWWGKWGCSSVQDRTEPAWTEDRIGTMLGPWIGPIQIRSGPGKTRTGPRPDRIWTESSYCLLLLVCFNSSKFQQDRFKTYKKIETKTHISLFTLHEGNQYSIQENWNQDKFKTWALYRKENSEPPTHNHSFITSVATHISPDSYFKTLKRIFLNQLCTGNTVYKKIKTKIDSKVKTHP